MHGWKEGRSVKRTKHKKVIEIWIWPRNEWTFYDLLEGWERNAPMTFEQSHFKVFVLCCTENIFFRTLSRRVLVSRWFCFFASSLFRIPLHFDFPLLPLPTLSSNHNVIRTTACKVRLRSRRCWSRDPRDPGRDQEKSRQGNDQQAGIDSLQDQAAGCHRKTYPCL